MEHEALIQSHHFWIWNNSRYFLRNYFKFSLNCGFICICHLRERRATLVRSPSQDQSTDPLAKNSAEWGLWAMLAYSIFPQLLDFHAHSFTVIPYRKPLAGKKCEFPSPNKYFGHRCCNNWKTWLEGIWAKFSTTELNLSLRFRKTLRQRRATQKKSLASWILEAKPIFHHSSTVIQISRIGR